MMGFGLRVSSGVWGCIALNTRGLVVDGRLVAGCPKL